MGASARRRLLVCVALLLAAAWPVPAAAQEPRSADDAGSGAPQETSGIRWSVRHAGGGIHRLGGVVSLRVALENRSTRDTFVEVSAEGDASDLFRRVDLPAGTAKDFPFYVFAGSYGDTCFVSLREPDGPFEVLAEVRSESVPMDATTVGILGPAAMGWEILERDEELALTRGHLRPADLPDHAEALKGFDLLVWPDPRPGELRPEQVGAVRRWVAEGGRLAILVSERWLEASAGGLQPWTSIRVTAPAPAWRLPSVAAVAGVNGVPAFDTPLAVPRVEGGEEWLADPGGSLARAEDRGLGRVTVIGLDPSRPELSGWEGWPDFWYAWAGPERPARSEGGLPRKIAAGSASDVYFDSLRVESSIALPSMGWILLLFVGYLVLIGPLEYFLLQRKGRLHWTWLTFPLMVAAISSASYLIAEAAHEADSALRGLVVRDLWVDYDLVTEEVYGVAFLSRQGVYTMESLRADAVALPAYAPDGYTVMRGIPGAAKGRLEQGPPRTTGRVARWSHFRGRFADEAPAEGAAAEIAWRAVAEVPAGEPPELQVSGRIDLGAGSREAWLVARVDGALWVCPLGAVEEGRRFDATCDGQRIPGGPPRAFGGMPIPTEAKVEPWQALAQETSLRAGRGMDWGRGWLASHGGVLLVRAADRTPPIALAGRSPSVEEGPVFYRIPVTNAAGGDDP